ncbi:MAG: tetratricopeptide repeat protein [Bacteroidota bacterium]
MKIRTFIYIISSLSILTLASCGGSGNNTEITSKDSVSQNVPEQLKLLNSQLLSDPSNADLYHNRAKYYFNAQSYNEGLADIKKALNIDSTKAAYYLTLSDLYFVNNKTGNAKTALEKCIRLDDKNIDAMLKLAELYLYVLKHEESMKYINMALRIDQFNAKAYFMKGMNYKELKDTTRAISSMQTAVEQDQEYYHAYIQLGILCAAKKNPLAVQYYKNAIRLSSRSVEAWYNLGKYYQDTEDFKNALETYTTLIQFDANNVNAHYNMGAIHLLHLKKYDVAINHFTAAIKANPKYVQAYYGRGLSYQAKGDIKEAKVNFQSCLAINPKYDPAQTALKQLGQVN